MGQKQCSICGRLDGRITRGMCWMHYMRWHTHGDPTVVLKKKKRDDQTVAEWFLTFVDKPESGCWEWTGFKDRNGYGKFNALEGEQLAHRAAYRLFVGEIRKDLTLDHICRNRGCVNPEHLDCVSHSENMRRSPLWKGTKNAAKTHCRKGHPYDATNTFRYRDGRRDCRTCMNERNRLARLRLKGVS